MGLYKGIAAPAVGFSVINSIIFGVHGSVMHHLEPDTASHRPSIFNSTIAGGVAGAVQCSICSPMELVRIRMQIQGINEPTHFLQFGHHRQKRMYKNSLDCLIKIYKNGGIQGVYDGLIPTLFREVPAFMAYFATWDYLCRKIDDGTSKHKIALPYLMLAGGISGISAWVISYPVDVVKTRVQIDGIGGTEYNGMIDCFKKTYIREGWRAFFKGLSPTLIRAFPVNAVTFPVQVFVLHYLRQ